MRVPVVLAGTAVVLATAAACGGGSSGGTKAAGAGPVQHPKSLVGEVGKDDKFQISLTDQSGTPIRNIAAGTYSLKVSDDSTIHDFHLTGSGVDDATQVGSVETKTFTVTFKPGSYSFVCDPHSSTMHGTFRVS